MISLSIIGHIGADARIRYVNGKDVINFSVCATKRWKNSAGDLQEKSFWVEVALWSRANLLDHLNKGTTVWVSGEPGARAWTNKSTGELQVSLLLTADEVELVSKSKTNNQ